jgi:hypothetical protein
MMVTKPDIAAAAPGEGLLAGACGGTASADITPQ